MQLFLHQNGEQVGPYTEEQIAAMVSSGAIERDDVIWREGLADWQPIHTVVSLPNPIAPMAPALPVPPVLKKIRLGTSLAALLLFFLPWIDIQCSEKSMVTQSGLQVIYGGGSPSEEMMASLGVPNSNTKSISKNESQDSMGFAPLIGLALVDIIAASVFGFIALTGENKRANSVASILPVVALGAILLQLMIGFPAKKKVLESMAESASKTQTSGEPFEELGKSMASAMMMNIRVKPTTGFYLELIALGIPSLIFANGLIDNYRNKRTIRG